MEPYSFEMESDRKLNLLEREERCQKSMKTVAKAIAMRIFVCGLLIWAVIRSDADAWVAGLLLLVLIINISGILPLITEFRKCRQEWQKLLEEE